MKISEFFVQNFGIFSGSGTSLSKGLTIFHGENESGKTTLMNFFRRILFPREKYSRTRGNIYEPLSGARHGFTIAGLPSYNHAVGNIFNPVVTMIFTMKTLAFALSVALLPVANALRDIPLRPSRTSVELQGLVQMFVLMLVIEIASLVGNYY